jgi:putative transposase
VSLRGIELADEITDTMPRRVRGTLGGFAYHVINRAVRRATLFESDWEYAIFEQLIWQGLQRAPVLLFAYSAMPNHWHLVLWCPGDHDLPRFMHWITMRHAQLWHVQRGTRGTGPVYQGRYKAVRIESDDHFLVACRYVERNALKARLVTAAEEWRWCSLWRRQNHCSDGHLQSWPIPVPADWIATLNALK